MKVGIVILNYNSKNLTSKLVNKCIKYKLINKIVIVDNDSNDLFSELEDSFLNSSKVYFIKNTINSGYASGNNIGLKYLADNNYDIGIVANPDVLFEEETIDNIVNEFKTTKFKYPVISCCRTLNGTKNTGQYWWIPSFFSALIESTYLGRKYLNHKCVRKTNMEVANSSAKEIVVEVLGGAFFAIDLKFLKTIGFLDENTFLWYEENILATKVKKENKKELLLLNCEYQHNHVRKTKVNKNLPIFMKSKHYYCKKYLKINFLQELLLYIAEFIGIAEQTVINLIYKILRK